MILNLLVGCLLIILSTVLHALAMGAAFTWLRISQATGAARKSMMARVMIVSQLVVIMTLASFVEGGIWALAYLATGAVSGLEQALYFSTVTYTTLGFGDVTLTEEWRLLSSLEAACGIIMFGWTTAIIVAVVQHVALPHHAAGDSTAPGS